MKNKALVSILIIVVLVAAALFYKWQFGSSIKEQSAGAEGRGIYSFEDCAAAGKPVTETYPRTCTVGKITFEETLQEEQTVEPVVFQNLRASQRVESPLEVRGTALGSWFFEANIGLRVLDANGKEVAKGHAEATSDWMSTGPVPFKGTISFTKPTTATGFIEVQKDNPSGNPDLDGSARLPVRFK